MDANGVGVPRDLPILSWPLVIACMGLIDLRTPEGTNAMCARSANMYVYSL